MKRFIKHVMTCCGIAVSYLVPFKNKSGLFFFFPFYHTGGAERVHADIIECFEVYSPYVFFTNKSEDSVFRPVFSKCAKHIFNVWWLMPAQSFLAGLITGYVNRHEKAVVFSCNNRLFYDILPLFKPSVRRIDLLHAFGGGMEDMSLSFVPCLDARVVITRKTVEDYKLLYQANGIDSKYAERIVLIENKVNVPQSYPVKESEQKVLRITYVGRGTEEKRVHLVGKVATICKRHQIPAAFTLVGEVYDAVENADKENCRFAGKIISKVEIMEIYRNSDLLLLTSSREGLPMVVMEAMAFGVVPVCTDVGGISQHVKHGVNGMLVDNSSETAVAGEMAEIIKSFANDKAELNKMSHAAYDYARDHFSSVDFCKKYHQVILGWA